MNRSIIIILFSTLLAAGKALSQDQSMMMNPVTGGKIFFADKPFTNDHNDSKTSFNSSGFIYGRLELENTTLQKAFDISTEDAEAPMYLRCWVMVFKNGVEIGQHQLWEFIHVKKGEQLKSSFNFDVLPDPANASTAVGGSKEFEPAVAAGPLYHRVRPETFSSDGEYTIKVRLYLKKFDAWDNLAPTAEWPMVQGEFKFQFYAKDISAILSNYKKATEAVKAKMKR